MKKMKKMNESPTRHHRPSTAKDVRQASNLPEQRASPGTNREAAHAAMSASFRRVQDGYARPALPPIARARRPTSTGGWKP